MSQSIKDIRLNRRIRRGLRKGLTLIEAAMVLTILALVIGGVMLYYSSASTSRQISEAAGQLAATQQAVRAAYAGQSNYGALTVGDIYNSLPAKMWDGTSLHHSFGGTLTVAAGDGGGGTNTGFTVTLNNVPKEGCLKLAVLDQGRTIASESLNGGSQGVAGSTLPITPAVAKTGCSGAYNTMAWTFN